MSAPGWDKVTPAEAIPMVADVMREVADMIRPEGTEPMCCDTHAAVWQARTDLADELTEETL